MIKKSYLIFQGTIWVVFLCLDLLPNSPERFSDPLKYCGLLSCLGFVILHRKQADPIDWHHLFWGLALTCGCDYFLLFTDSAFFPLLIFAGVHVIYCHRNFLQLQKKIVLAYFGGALLLLLGIQQKWSYSTFSSGLFYAVFLLTDVISTFRSQHPKRQLLQVALLLFLLCDITVAAFNLLPGSTQRLVGPLMWFFYFPAQVLLSLSAAPLQLLTKKPPPGDTALSARNAE